MPISILFPLDISICNPVFPLTVYALPDVLNRIPHPPYSNIGLYSRILYFFISLKGIIKSVNGVNVIWIPLFLF